MQKSNQLSVEISVELSLFYLAIIDKLFSKKNTN